MKNLCIVIALLVFSIGVRAQSVCSVPVGFVCVTQQAADRIAHDLDELKAARDTIAAFKGERLTTDAERTAYKTLTDALTAAFDARGKVVADQAAIIEIQAKALTLYSTLVDKLAAQINRPKSAFSKLMQTLKEIALIATGLAIGTHL